MLQFKPILLDLFDNGIFTKYQVPTPFSQKTDGLTRLRFGKIREAFLGIKVTRGQRKTSCLVLALALLPKPKGVASSRGVPRWHQNHHRRRHKEMLNVGGAAFPKGYLGIGCLDLVNCVAP
ncbi:hypothetical protein GS597_08870 [Synechococcales cyanobacterium C]|uniref:Uncharacterized protein n=1 Tax=Petrachloros mirabilis ULC683 TaxID=2781853 RepID=A0A8K1ZYV2_9CYAN|nr:hypothetical protein [Petrachloros mirabilis]NCJ06613.1 hypothetical protein [Petrachloros mirabilis ULC683]